MAISTPTSGRSAGFGVLKSPDIPLVLVELGFMSDARDLENLTSDDWRKAAAVAIRNGLIAWADADGGGGGAAAKLNCPGWLRRATATGNPRALSEF